jgi:hypothetical protein
MPFSAWRWPWTREQLPERRATLREIKDGWIDL